MRKIKQLKSTTVFCLNKYIDATVFLIKFNLYVWYIKNALLVCNFKLFHSVRQYLVGGYSA